MARWAAARLLQPVVPSPTVTSNNTVELPTEQLIGSQQITNYITQHKINVLNGHHVRWKPHCKKTHYRQPHGIAQEILAMAFLSKYGMTPWEYKGVESARTSGVKHTKQRIIEPYLSREPAVLHPLANGEPPPCARRSFTRLKKKDFSVNLLHMLN